MKDIYNTTVEFGGSWVLDGAVISLDNGNELIVNRADLQYGRPVNRILPLNTSKQYIIAGRGQGQITLGIIVGPYKAITDFIKKYADACAIDTNTITLSAMGHQCESGNATTSSQQRIEFVGHYCLLQNISASVQAGELAIVSAGLVMMIGGLEMKTGA